MSGPKTRATDESVEDFLNAIEHPLRKADGLKLLQLFKEETCEEPVMWGSSIIGFGSFKYNSGKEID